MSHKVLLLNADYRPIRIISWERAFIMWLDEKVDLVEGYLEKIRTASMDYVRPAVVRLKRYVKLTGRVRYKRRNVLERDGYQCQYCGRFPKDKYGSPDMSTLTLDHVVPRAHARRGKVILPWNKKEVNVTSWENIVTACYSCNNSKADRAPEQAGMELLRKPRKPTPQDALRMNVIRSQVPPEWEAYLIL